MDQDGYFYLVDRKKDMIISGGFNVYPQMIEQAIYEHPAVQEAIVIEFPTITAAMRRRLLSNCAPAQTVHAGGIEGLSRRQLGKHEIPAALEFVDELPRTSVGKLSRHELRNRQPAPKQPQLASGGSA